ncbi:hypothetical protein [Mycetocola zhadangensis]|uniref:Uncharacterized protein n=1 Tax=Mycetocola zhadangensis TaxID=1164595 RepID=A0A3L7J4V8_9MICO|nr:hypothetical protein [Mycetocola zhadangensis]RLQ85355.1 hypothetical protein D9V28_00205 [Mycetocola zhadangensis]GGE81896.1 hypothetical protein GCM10011313_00400 [Mycetocola zhadangensis]
MNRISKLLHGSDRDSGYALVMVLGIGMLLTIMVVTAMSFSTSGMKKSRQDQDASGALAAAYAGVDEYKSRLLADSTYSKYGNGESAFTQATGSVVDLPIGADVNPAFGVGAAGSWASVGDTDSPAKFRYEVDNSQLGESGVLRIRSTGKVGKETRSVVADLKARGFIDFLYFTDFEIQDPSLRVDADGNPTCKDFKHEWEPDPNRLGCTGITFDGDDKVDGPAHSNDTVHICKATFTGKVTSADPNAPFYSPRYAKNAAGGSAGSCTQQKFDGGAPSYDSNVPMPVSNLSMLRETQADIPDDVPRPGCLYTGPTRITFLANGKMTVYSPWTKNVHGGTGTISPGVTVPNCGTPSVVGGQTGLGAVGGQTVNVPDNNLIYVQGVPGTVGDPNYWAADARPHNLTCKGTDGTTEGNGIGFPSSRVKPAVPGGWGWPGTPAKTISEAAPSSSSYGCRSGDVFVQGTLKGRVTVAAGNFVYATGDITYADTSLDMLGLVGGKAVWVWNPKDTEGALMDTTKNRTIHAAILSVENTFLVQNVTTSPARGELRILGAIAQKYRGIISQGGGYTKRYDYDERMKETAPPKFLAPAATTYGVTSLADVGDAFNADGSCAVKAAGDCR